MLRQVERDYQTCDWCGAMTRGRTQIEEPTVLRCGACHYPLSEGSYRVEAPRQVVKIEIQNPAPTAHGNLHGMWDEHQSEWIRLAGEWSGPAYLRT